MRLFETPSESVRSFKLRGSMGFVWLTSNVNRPYNFPDYPLVNFMNKENQFYFELGKRIRKARLKQRLTQKQLADLLSLNRTSITNIERGIQRLLVHTVVTIASELRVPVEALIPVRVVAYGSSSITELLSQSNSADERKFLKSALKRISKG